MAEAERRREVLRSLASHCSLESFRGGWLVRFHGHTIGTVTRNPVTGTWIGQGADTERCCFMSTRYGAVAKVLMEYHLWVGSSSRAHNRYLDEVQERLASLNG